MLTASDVAIHNNRGSCWIIIEGHVYDVTDFLEEHPGGPDIILRYAGKDATEEYLPVHPPRTIENELPREKHLGAIAPSAIAASLPKIADPPGPRASHSGIPLSLCLNLFDFERAAEASASRRAWTYYSSAADDLYSHHLNLRDWARVTFRPRVLRNVRQVDMRRTILGHQCNLPIFIAPAALARLGHPDGELCLIRGASKYNIPYAVSTASSVSAEDLSQYMNSEAVGGCLYFQLYVKIKESETRGLIRRARSLNFKALIVTVDTPVVGKREQDDRYKAEVAIAAGETVMSGPPLINTSVGDEAPVHRGPYSSTLNWEHLKWIREEWGSAGPICLKGIGTAEDAKMACDMGIDCIYLSNHGGRQLDSSPSSLRTLLEIHKFCPEVLDRCEVILDGGVRRGADIVKALCLGARAVGIGRPFMYALSSHGTEGVAKVIQILGDELQSCMRLLGVTSLAELRPHMVNTRELDMTIMATLPEFKFGKAGKTRL
ncbi:Cytochrome b2, mitochondrial [Lachnellula cervina]|uniref:L-lactate dehydrogenase (cytochrome) n=1 Tax=Lachnellula cervina TaxID=1316786 RepID=A0A7D8YRZ3_9HELO|nr:Cytochrome b2, mitochondrial [Lachnellula cervina]